MQFSQISTVIVNILSLSFVGVVIAEWVRLRLAFRTEERRHIAHAISRLLEFRYIILSLHEIPKLLPALVPKELKGQVPGDLWSSIDLTQILPIDNEMPTHYRAAVEEIAGFHPVLAHKLRGKEQYLDFRKTITQRLSAAPGSPSIASRITEVLDREWIPALEQALCILAKAHSVRMRLSIMLELRRSRHNTNPIAQTILDVFHEQILQVAKSERARPVKPGPPKTVSDPSLGTIAGH